MSEVLKPLALDKWSLLAETLKKNWPSNVQYYYFIQTAIKWKAKDENIPMMIYCPSGDYNSGVFVAVSSQTYYFIVTFAHEDFEDLLFKAVTETKFLNWDKSVCFAAVHSRLAPTVTSIIEHLKQKKGVEVRYYSKGHCFFKSKEECSNFEEQLPDDCYLKELDETHLPLIFSVWPLRHVYDLEISYKYALAMIQFNKGLGLFSKDTDELLSWAMQSEFGAISLVQTMELYRRRGYSRIVTNTLAKQLAAKGTDSFVFIDNGNHLSETMFTSWNFKPVEGYNWIGLK